MSSRNQVGHEKLSGAWNFRDVTQTAGIARGRLFRSSELSKLDDAGRAALTEIGVTDVADLRSPAELARRGPGAVPDDVVLHHLPFPEVSHSHSDSDEPAEAPHETAWQKMMTEYSDEEPAEAGQRWMTNEYERFPTLGGAQRAVRKVITLLADGRAVLVHCFAGKDRTGFAVAIALEAAGELRRLVRSGRAYTLADPTRERFHSRLRYTPRRALDQHSDLVRAFLDSHPQIGREDAASLLGVVENSASRILAELTRQGVIEPVSNARGPRVRYRLVAPSTSTHAPNGVD